MPARPVGMAVRDFIVGGCAFFYDFNIEIKTVYFNLVNEQSIIDACHSQELLNVDAVILAPIYTIKEDECIAIFKNRNIPVVEINTSTEP